MQRACAVGLHNMREAGRWKRHDEGALCCAVLDGDSGVFLSGGEDGFLCATDTRQPNPVGRLRLSSAADDAVAALAAWPGPSGGAAFAACGSSVARVDARRGLSSPEALVWHVGCGSEEINALALDGRGSSLFAGDDAGDLICLDVSHGQASDAPPPPRRRARRAHAGLTTALAWVPSRRPRLLSGGTDCLCQLWEPRQGTLPRRLLALSCSALGEERTALNPPMVHSLAAVRLGRRSAPLARAGQTLAAAALGDGHVSVALFQGSGGRDCDGAVSRDGEGRKKSGVVSAAPCFSRLCGDRHAHGATAVVWAGEDFSTGASPAPDLSTLSLGEEGAEGLSPLPILLSGGNDRRVLAWRAGEHAGGSPRQAPDSGQAGLVAAYQPVGQHLLRHKVNGLCAVGAGVLAADADGWITLMQPS